MLMQLLLPVIGKETLSNQIEGYFLHFIFTKFLIMIHIKDIF